jgi:hypothetical protein
VYFHLRPNLGMPTPKPSSMYILSNSGKLILEWVMASLEFIESIKDAPAA